MKPESRADRPAVRLSEPLRVTLFVEGDAPLRVELPKELLDAPSSAAWRARPDGPAAVTDLPGGRQRWGRTYRLDPYQPGEFAVGFAPARVLAGTDPQSREVSWPAVPVRVTTEVRGDPSEVRPPTGIEELPPAARAGRPLQDRAIPPATIGAAVLAVGAAVWLLRRRPVRKPTPEEWATARLGELTVSDAAFAERLSDTLRGFVEGRAGVAAARLTSAEVLAELERGGAWPPERLADLAAALAHCDRAKFAGGRPAPDEAAELLAVAARIIQPAAAVAG